MTKILVTGANGQLGRELQQLVREQKRESDFVFASRREMDLNSNLSIEAFLHSQSWTAIVHGAAWTAVDQAEDHLEECRQINAHASQIISEFASQAQIPLVHISTDYVFDGNSHLPLSEAAPCNPIGVYGLTKWEGEQAVLKSGARAAILRTSWVYSQYGNNFVKTMRRLGAERDLLNVVDDQIGSPTWARDLALAILHLLNRAEFPMGVFHFSNQGCCSWYDFAQAIMEISQLKCQVRPIHSDAYPAKVKRPHFSLLDKSKFEKTTEYSIPYWRHSLIQCIAQLG